MAIRPELLAPAGNPACLRAAVAAGVDAVYFGGSMFNARSNAGNFGVEEIAEAIKLCRLRGVRTNLTLNTLIKETEWDSFTAYADEVLALRPDAVIVQDLAVADYIRRRFPEIELHGSTQMTVHDAEGALFLQKRGFTRVVLSRELSVAEIKAIRAKTDIELECFLHGALCFSYSGRCLLSSFHGGRSGNRGTCAQPCRLKYKLGGEVCCPMNLKDLCGADELQALLEAGVCSLKIEGRMKGIPYVYGVTETYRSLLDSYEASGRVPELTDAQRENLCQLFNRGAFTDGYLKDDKASMVSDGSPKHWGVPIGRVSGRKGDTIYLETKSALSAGDLLEIHTGSEPYPTVRLSASMLENKPVSFKLKEGAKGDEVYRLISAALDDEYQKKAEELPRRPVAMFAELRRGDVSRLTMTLLDGDGPNGAALTVSALGETVQESVNAPMSEASVRENLAKLGTSPFYPETIEIAMDPDIFMPVSALKELRRTAVTALRERILDRSSDFDIEAAVAAAKAAKAEKEKAAVSCETPSATEAAGKETPSLVLRVANAEQWKSVLSFAENGTLPKGALISTECCDAELLQRSRDAGLTVSAALRPITREKFAAQDEAEMKAFLEAGFDRFEVQHLGELNRVQTAGKASDIGFFMSVMNLEAFRLLKREGAETVCLSAELSSEELNAFRGQSGAVLPVYGRIPLMLSEQCFFKQQNKGCRPDADGHTVRLTDRTGSGLIARSHCERCMSILYEETPLYLGDKNLRGFIPALSFTTENAAEVERVLRAFLKKEPLENTNRGHFHSPVI